MRAPDLLEEVAIGTAGTVALITAWAMPASNMARALAVALTAAGAAYVATLFVGEWIRHRPATGHLRKPPHQPPSKTWLPEGDPEQAFHEQARWSRD